MRRFQPITGLHFLLLPLIIAATVGVATPVGAASTPLDTVLAALKKEEAAPLERVRLFTQIGSVSDLYYFDRLLPDRAHSMKNPQSGGTEAIVIGKTQWVRSDGNWTQSLASGAVSKLLPPIADLLRQGLSETTETADHAGGRLVEGKMTWNLGSPCDGKLGFHISKQGLPAFMEFVGTCAGKPAHFNQAYSFFGPLKIEAPQ